MVSSLSAALLAPSATRAPSAANARAAARPIPELPPVMTATFPSKSLFILGRITKHPPPMHWSKLFIPTLRPTLRDDHPLMERAGYMRRLSSGIDSHLFLAQRSLLKIAAIV